MPEDNLLSIHRELIRNHIDDPSNEDEMMLWMLLIHTHAVRLVKPLAGNITLIHGATQRVAAAAVADLWSDREDKEKTLYVYWYHEYAHRYHSKSLVPANDAAKIETLRTKIEADPRVEYVVLDED
jgi:hypothetical protein